MKKYQKIYDNFFPQELFEEIAGFVNNDENAQWYFTENTPGRNISGFEDSEIIKKELGLKENIIPFNFVQMLHPVYNSKGWTTHNVELFTKVVDFMWAKLNMEILITTKMNLTWPSQENYITGFHKDFVYDNTPNYKTAILYIGDNDGYSLLEDGTKIESVANRMVVFDGDTFHSGTTCTDTNKRVTMNVNFIGKNQ